ncbi:MAG: M1 family metallopeptidase [Flavitalea sp.]
MKLNQQKEFQKTNLFRNLLTSLLILLSLNAFAQSASYNNPLFDVQHYDFQVELSDETDMIKGETTLQIKAVKQVGKIDLDLASISNGKGMKVVEVSAEDKKLKFTHSSNLLSITPSKTLKAGDEFMLTITYEGIPSDGLIISKNKFNKRTFFADNWPNRAHNWLPTVDHPSDKATVDFEVIAPMHYQVIANGIQVEESNLPSNKKLTRYHEDVPLPTKVMVLGLAEFSVQTIGQVDCIPVTAWVYADDRKNAQAAFQPAADALNFFIKNVGPYPYKKLANVQSKTIFGGLENANAIFYFENSVNGKNENEGLVVHEVAHQWFGNSASETHFSHLWLSEGFASYFTHLYMEQKYGRDSLAGGLKTDRNQVVAYSRKSSTPIVDTTKNNYMDLLNANSYQKGSWVLHMLRNNIGDSSFWKGIRNYYATYAGKNASTDDFRKIMEQASGQDLKKFFQQWLFSPGQPELQVQSAYKDGKATYTIIQTQKQLFEFPLQIEINTGDVNKLTKSVQVKERETSFTIPMEKQPVGIKLDPNVNLLFSEKK